MPWGVAGGQSGLGSRVSITKATGEPVELPLLTKGHGIELNAGDRVVLESCGGGGYGDPLERSEADVVQDVEAGLTTRARLCPNITNATDCRAGSGSNGC